MQALRSLNDKIEGLEQELNASRSRRQDVADRECSRLCKRLREILGEVPKELAKDFDFEVFYYTRRDQFRINVVLKSELDRTVELVPEFDRAGEIDAFNMMVFSGSPYWFCFTEMKMLREGKVPDLVHKVTKFVHWMVSKAGREFWHPKRLAEL